jgi:5-methylcytosine-specific restriction endonuclease McrA
VVLWPQQTYCSKRCQGRAHSSRRDARKRGAFVADVSPEVIYERDQWQCHLCGGAIDKTAQVPHPLAPTIDHVIPLAKGGTHEPDNVAAAHFLCNATKGDRHVIALPQPIA